MKYANVVQREKTTVNRLQRVTRRGEFLRATWEFEVVLNLGQQEITEKTMTSLQYLPNFAPTVGNFKSFQWKVTFRDLIEH